MVEHNQKREKKSKEHKKMKGKKKLTVKWLKQNDQIKWEHINNFRMAYWFFLFLTDWN